jgi:hypothetical protein
LPDNLAIMRRCTRGLFRMSARVAMIATGAILMAAAARTLIGKVAGEPGKPRTSSLDAWPPVPRAPTDRSEAYTGK